MKAGFHRTVPQTRHCYLINSVSIDGKWLSRWGSSAIAMCLRARAFRPLVQGRLGRAGRGRRAPTAAERAMADVAAGGRHGLSAQFPCPAASRRQSAAVGCLQSPV